MAFSKRIRNAQVGGSSPFTSSISLVPVMRLCKLSGGDFSFPIRRHALNVFYHIFTRFFASMGVNMGVKFNLLINISRFSSKNSPEALAPGENYESNLSIVVRSVRAVRQSLAYDVAYHRRAAENTAADGLRDLAVAAESHDKPSDKSRDCYP